MLLGFENLCCRKDSVQRLLETLLSTLSSVGNQLYEVDASTEKLELSKYFLGWIRQPRFSTNDGGCGGGLGGEGGYGGGGGAGG